MNYNDLPVSTLRYLSLGFQWKVLEATLQQSRNVELRKLMGPQLDKDCQLKVNLDPENGAAHAAGIYADLIKELDEKYGDVKATPELRMYVFSLELLKVEQALAEKLQ